MAFPRYGQGFRVASMRSGGRILARGLSLFAFALMLGCDAPSRSPPREVISASQFQPSTYEFTTTETVRVEDFGAIGDGHTVNTDAFARALGEGNRTVIVTPGDYLISKLSIPSNTRLVLEPGVILRDTGELGYAQSLLTIRTENVYIDGLGARVLANRRDYTTGEYRHGVLIFGAHNVVVNGLESSSHGGDGFYIGRNATDIALLGCRAENNRRQGLSITSASRVYVADCEFNYTRGTAPEFGIDVEPNAPTDLIREITIIRPYSLANDGGGILIFLDKFDASSQPATITILDHVSELERPLVQSNVRPTDLIRYGVTP